METTKENQIVKERLAKLTLESIKDEDFAAGYPFLGDFLWLIETEFPEIRLVLTEKEFYTLVIAKYIATYQEYFTNRSLGVYDKAQLNELFETSLRSDLKVSYYSEVQQILEKDFTKIYEELETYPKNRRKAIYANLAAEVYKEKNGNEVRKHIYISPYASGYNDEEYYLIREILSSIIYNMTHDLESENPN